MQIELNQEVTKLFKLNIANYILSHDVAPGIDITPCNKIDKPQVVYRFSTVT